MSVETYQPPVFHGAGDEEPITNGVYVALIYWGWKLLEFHDGVWWHPTKTSRWGAGDPERWVGPLPEREPSPNVNVPLEFDL